MKKSNFLPQFIIATSLATVLLLGISAWALKRAKAEVPDLPNALQETLRAHFKTDKIYFHFTNDSGDSDNQISSEQSFPMPIEKIDVRTVSAEIRIQKVEGLDVVRLKSGGQNQMGLRVSAQNKILAIDQQAEGGTPFLALEVPANFKGEISFKTISGDIEISDLTATTLLAQTVSGDVDVENAKTQSLQLSTVSGDVGLKANEFRELQIKTVSGDVEMRVIREEINPYAFHLQSASGEITNQFKDLTAGPVPVSISTMSGEIDIDSL